MSKFLKFCMITTFYPPHSFGGDAMYIYRLSNELAKRGHTVDVFHSEDAYNLLRKNASLGDFPNHPNVNVIGLRSKNGLFSSLFTQQTGIPFFEKQIQKTFNENQYDVIHYHNMSLIGITALSYHSSAVKLYTTHEHWLICPMHTLWKFDREVCTKKSCMSCQVAGLRPPQLWRYSNLLEDNIKHIDCFISPSRFTLNKHLENGLQIPIRHIPYFLPTPINEVNEVNIKGKPYFLFVGRLEKIKGLQNIIPIFKANQNYDLFIVGEGEYKDKLENLADNYPNIRFLGKLDQHKLMNLYRQASAVIVPSVCYETFGIIIIESFAMKTPVIVNNLGALPESVTDSGGGFIYNNENELLEAIYQIANTPGLRDDLGNKGYAAFLKYWNEDAHLAQYFGLIEELQNNSLRQSIKS